MTFKLPFLYNVSDCQFYPASHFSRAREIYHIFIRWSIRTFFLHPRYTFDVQGQENLPKKGNFIIAANHISLIDPPIVSCILDVPVAFMSKKELFGKWYKCFFYYTIGCFAVDRDAPDLSTIKTALNVLKSKSNWALGIFPEGTRSLDGQIQPFKKGALSLAIKAGAVVVPVGIQRKDNAFVVKVGQALEPGDSAEALKDKLFDALVQLVQ